MTVWNLSWGRCKQWPSRCWSAVTFSASENSISVYQRAMPMPPGNKHDISTETWFSDLSSFFQHFLITHVCGAVICRFFEGGVLYWGFSSPFRVWNLACGFREESSGRPWHLNQPCWHQFLELWMHWELLGGIHGSKMSWERRVCLVPGCSCKQESKKVIVVSSPPTCRWGPGENRGLSTTGSASSWQLSLQTSFQTPFTLRYGWLLLNLLGKTNYKQPVDPIIHWFVWSGHKISENYALDAEREKQSSR